MGKSIASCGHEIKQSGISFSINGFTKFGTPCLNHITYCPKCVYLLMYDNKLFDFKKEIKDTDIGSLKLLLDQSK